MAVGVCTTCETRGVAHRPHTRAPGCRLYVPPPPERVEAASQTDAVVDPPPDAGGVHSQEPSSAIMTALDAIQRRLASVVETQEWQSQQIDQLCTVTTSLQEQVETVQERCFHVSQRLEQHIAEISSGKGCASKFRQESFDGETLHHELGG